MKYLVTEEQFNELKEQIDDSREDNMCKIIKTYLDMKLPEHYGVKRFSVKYNNHFERYEIDIFFDWEIAVELGGKINSLIRLSLELIAGEIDGMFSGLRFALFQHFEK